MTAAVQLAQSVAPGVSLGFKNRIINGAMMIDQRNAGASVTPSNSEVYPVDRTKVRLASGSGHTAQRSTTAPSGFINSMLVTIGTGASPGSTDNNYILQYIEGFNVADLGWGASSAATVTLSFWVRSSVTGTFSGSLLNTSFNRSYPFTYTISTQNTFEYKTVTISGDITGTWATDNSVGIAVMLDLGSGATYQGPAGSWAAARYQAATGATKLVATSGATLYLTGLQLEVGTSATPFEFRDYGRELMLCQRYYEKGRSMLLAARIDTGSSYYSNTWTHPFKQTKRTTPTLSVTMTGGGTFGWSATTEELLPNGYVYGSPSGNTTISGDWAASAEL